MRTPGPIASQVTLFIRSNGPGKNNWDDPEGEKRRWKNVPFTSRIVCAAAVSLLSRCVGKDSACMDVCIGGRRWSREPDGGRVGRRAGSGACILHFPDKAQERFLSMTRHAPRIRGKSRNRTLGKPGLRRKKKYSFSSAQTTLSFNAN